MLFAEAQDRLREGRSGAALVTLETLVAVYPESCLVGPARQLIQTLEEETVVVRTVRFTGLKRISTEEALRRFDERELPLSVDSRYEPESLEQAKRVLQELLAEKGLTRARVTASARTIAPRQVEVTFRVAPQRWRLIAMLPLP